MSNDDFDGDTSGRLGCPGHIVRTHGDVSSWRRGDR